MKSKPTVFIVDDDPAMRNSTALLFDSAGLHCELYPSATAFLEAYRPQRPGCVVLDLSMPGMSGLDLVARFRERSFKIPIIIVSGTGTIPLVVEGMKLGVIDFLEKPTDPAHLIERVKLALDLDARQRNDNASLEPINQKLALLTDREKQLLRLLVRGLSSKQIAAELDIAVKTVENHRAKLLQKTGALNAADLTRMAMLANVF